MFKHAYVVVSVVALAMGVMASLAPSPALAASPEGLESDAQAALKSLYGSTPTAKTLGDAAKGIMVFPNIVKAGFIFGAQYGEGELLKRDQMAGIRGFRAWSRPEHRCRGCRNGQDPHDDDRPRRCLRVHLWPEGADGGDRLAGFENHPSQSVTSTARITLRRRSPLPGRGRQLRQRASGPCSPPTPREVQPPSLCRSSAP